MKPRADTLVFARRRLMALHHAGQGVLASERAAMDWDWLERALPERSLPGRSPAAWCAPLPSGRTAVLRVCHGAGVPDGALWAVAALVLEAPAYEWFLARAGSALSDEAWWNPAKLQVSGAVSLPEWAVDPEPTVDPAVVATLRKGGQMRVADTDGHKVVQAVVAPVRSLSRSGKGALVWSVGLPVPAPGAVMASVCEAAPGGAMGTKRPLPTAPTEEVSRPASRAPVRPAAESSAVAVPDPSWADAAQALEAPEPPLVSEPFRVQRVARGQLNWLPWACLVVMGGAFALAWRWLS